MERNSKGQFQNGSGNPKGRPANANDVKKLARQYTKESLETLAKIMRSPKAGYPARVAAAAELLNRGWGRVGPAGNEGNAPLAPSEIKVTFVKAVDGRPAGEPFALPPPGEPKLPVVVKDQQTLPAVVPLRYPRY